MKYETATFDNDGRLAIEGDARPNRRWWIIGIVAAMLAIGVAYFGFKHSAKPTAVAAKKEELPNVSIVVPGSKIVPRVVSATGSLAARREMPVGVAGEGGMVTRVLVEPGQWVQSGQVLAQVDRSVQSQTAASLAAQINVARSDAAIAQSELKRAESLVDRGFISKADLERKAATRDAALARVNVAQATLGEQRARNGRLDIRAPAAGLILTRSVEPGQIVSSGSGTLFRMAKGGEMEMRAALSEADLAGLPVGVAASVTPVGASQSFKGQVWQVSPVIDPTTRQGIARIALSYDPGLRPGGFAAAQITSGGARAPQLPNSAIQSDAAGNYVYVLDAQDRVVRRQITLGGVSDEGVMVASGLSGTERVVLSAGAFLSPGQKVKPILKNAQG
ncbi:secretion protein HylD [Sphingomonas sp. Leaf357]|uniref:efflux RND transporter periplasmic adaptor subunit n=1 Tax=Sphingomonas sp. Leaf357 TaxID=1736350 RepID=UPI0006F59AFD|nr:efflux RND transporter periplasmic adaptor subunit [Sphingomonas sp. Leaf357]KQS03930.1 secretion protein HylD [Sphingomonas sp. Leaf357]